MNTPEKQREMKTIAQQLNIKEFPFVIKNKNGKGIYWENSDGYWVKSEYDSNGNPVYMKNSEEWWAKWEYDSNGNPVYMENSDEFWCKWEYDSNGNPVYMENSNEYWSKKEYDSDGNETYYENSDGEIEDNRPKGLDGKVLEIDGKKYKLTELTNTNKQ